MYGECRLTPYGLVEPGHEAVYTGKPFTPGAAAPEGWPADCVDDGSGREMLRWSVYPWLFDADKERGSAISAWLNAREAELAPLSDEARRIRAHICSLVPCDNGIPATIDEMLCAIGRGLLEDVTFHNGCWLPCMWWDGRTTQPGQVEAMRATEDVLRGYLSGRSAEELTAAHPQAAGFIARTFKSFGPREQFTEVQQLMLERALLIFDYLCKRRDDQSVCQDCFSKEGRGAELDGRIAEAAGLPEIAIDWDKFVAGRDSIADPAKVALYRAATRIAFGIFGTSDCHHNTFRMIESWIHGIGQGVPEVPTRRHGAEAQRIGRLLFGYCLGLDAWLVARPMHFMLLDLGHTDLGFDPTNEVLRVFAWLGEERGALKEYLAALVWFQLRHNRPAGLSAHEELRARTTAQGVSVDMFFDRVLAS